MRRRLALLGLLLLAPLALAHKVRETADIALTRDDMTLAVIRIVEA